MTDRIPPRVDVCDLQMSVEKFFAIRLTDGELIYGEFGWVSCDGPNDWTVAEESDHDEATEYEIVEMTVRSVAKRTFGDPRDFHERVQDDCVYCAEPWPCEYLRELDRERRWGER